MISSKRLWSPKGDAWLASALVVLVKNLTTVIIGYDGELSGKGFIKTSFRQILLYFIDDRFTTGFFLTISFFPSHSGGK